MLVASHVGSVSLGYLCSTESTYKLLKISYGQTQKLVVMMSDPSFITGEQRIDVFFSLSWGHRTSRQCDPLRASAPGEKLWLYRAEVQLMGMSGGSSFFSFTDPNLLVFPEEKTLLHLFCWVISPEKADFCDSLKEISSKRKSQGCFKAQSCLSPSVLVLFHISQV